uniref:Protein kinase domain-containing protein n=1 Tax=Syphacia muris TaxID=451379 RepID=A0A0N5AVA2_9BILA
MGVKYAIYFYSSGEKSVFAAYSRTLRESHNTVSTSLRKVAASNHLTSPDCLSQAPLLSALYGLTDIKILGRNLAANLGINGTKTMVDDTNSSLCEATSSTNKSLGTASTADEEKKTLKSKNAFQRRHMTDGGVSRRWLLLMEPIDALFIACTLGAKGRIFRVDDNMALLLGYSSMTELLGTEIQKLIPAIQLDSGEDEQHVCAVGVRGNSIPVTVRVCAERDPITHYATMYELEIRALSAVNGVITLTNTGALHSFNENFIEALVGKGVKELAENEDVYITDLIPEFHSYILDNFEICNKDTDDSHNTGLNASSTKEDFVEESRKSSSFKGSATVPGSCQFSNNLLPVFTLNDSNSLKVTKQPTPSVPSGISATLSKEKVDDIIGDEKNSSSALCELKSALEDEKPKLIREGSFFGLAKHSDSNLIAVRFDIRRLDVGFPANWVVCIGYDRSVDFGLFGDDGASRKDSDAVCSSVDNDDDIDFGDRKQSTLGSEPSISLQTLENENAEAVRGEYSQHYNTFHLIGNGAFGSVKLAARKDTGLLAVAKFVCKAKVLPESWVKSPKRGNTMVPIEIHLLGTLSHPNIVKVLDIFENNTYYQLVMEKLGCGMDLFEFIDNQPGLDEPLTSYIFRQIVNAVAYLHSNKIVHRDVKDENVIIDQNFSCKLIDFGSAAYFGRDIVFSTFCGTMEYCSPEVLSGNKYRGPELEMWSLGVLLYTLVYFENPFRTLQETVRAEIELPWDVSDGLYQVIAWLLHRDPRLRATVNEIKNHWWVQQPINLRRYKFQDMLKSCGRAQIEPLQYASELATRLKNQSSCSALDSEFSRPIQNTNAMHAR